MQTVKEFINALGGTVSVATALDLPISTVSGWNLNNSIPRWREPGLKEIAAERGVAWPKSFAERAA